MKRVPTTLCIVQENERVLLGMKKRGFGAGRWNGFGGKVEEGESVESAALRETREEAGIEPRELVKVGELHFTFAGRPDAIEMHVFKVRGFTGTPSEGEEMRPRWFSVDEIPFHEMWSDDVHWFPLFLADRRFTGRFHFDEEDRVLEWELTEL